MTLDLNIWQNCVDSKSFFESRQMYFHFWLTMTIYKRNEHEIKERFHTSVTNFKCLMLEIQKIKQSTRYYKVNFSSVSKPPLRTLKLHMCRMNVWVFSYLLANCCVTQNVPYWTSRVPIIIQFSLLHIVYKDLTQ